MSVHERVVSTSQSCHEVIVQVFVHWTMTGTFEGEHTSSNGISLLRFEHGRIAETSVYRQALPAEVTLAQRSKRVDPVQQGILLEKRTSEVPDNP